MLLQGEELSNEQNEYVEKILFNTQRLSCLVGNILLLSKLENQNIPMKKTKYRRYREMEGRLSGRSVWTDGPFPLGGRSVCVSRRVCRAEDGEVPKRKEER